MEYGKTINLLINQIIHETNGDFHLSPITGDDMFWHCESYLSGPYQEIATDNEDLLTCLRNHKAKTDKGMALRMEES